MSNRYYVIATLGSSPAVLTELLWVLCAQEDASIVGVEVWTTGGPGASERSGQAQLGKFAMSGGFGDLIRALPGAALPDFSWPVPATEALDAAASGRRPYSIHIFARASEAGATSDFVEDVRDGRDARFIEVQLLERVRRLKAELPEDVQLLGSLAGGRKTMSSSLQNAFLLLAGPEDRLVHVLLNRAIELSEEPNWRTFTVPDPKWGLPLDEQVEVYDVPFPRLAPLMQRSPIGRPGHDLDFSTILKALDALARGDLRARLSRVDDNRWAYTISSVTGGPLTRIGLTHRQGQLFRLLIEERAPLSALELFERFDARGAPLDPDPILEDQKRGPRNLVSKLVSRLRKQLSPLVALGLGDFSVSSVRNRYTVPAAFDGVIDLEGDFRRS